MMHSPSPSTTFTAFFNSNHFLSAVNATVAKAFPVNTSFHRDTTRKIW
jgi:hypothetical protein